MARVKFDVGMTADLLSPEEHRAHLDGMARNIEVERLRGVKHMRLPSLQGTATGGVLLLGQAAPSCGPRDGFAWSIRCLVVDGLTASATTPDVVRFYLNNPTGNTFWELNGNSFGQTFGRLERTMYPGDTLLLANSGAFAATGVITVTGELIECPMEMLTKLA
jgi:hypothetical protein